MKITPIILTASMFMMATACHTVKSPKNSMEIKAVKTEMPVLIPYAPPIALETAGVKFYTDIPYGDAKENLFDLYMPQSSQPTSIVVFIHGGGFTSGDKRDAVRGAESVKLVNNLLAKNIAFASVNYTLLKPGNTLGILGCLNDSKRALQFIRYHAEIFNINKDQVILMGGSGGAGTSLWIAFNDDMADKKNSDPVLRQSTRVRGVIATATQANYNLLDWSNSVFKEYQSQGFNQAKIIEIITKERILNSAGLPATTDLNSPIIKSYGNKMDMLALMSADDPEIYVTNAKIEYKIPTNSNELNHHPLHAKALLDESLKKHVKARVSIPQMGIDTQNGESKLDFILRLIGE